jgi:hypothetical protein
MHRTSLRVRNENSGHMLFTRYATFFFFFFCGVICGEGGPSRFPGIFYVRPLGAARRTGPVINPESLIGRAGRFHTCLEFPEVCGQCTRLVDVPRENLRRYDAYIDNHIAIPWTDETVKFAACLF